LKGDIEKLLSEIIAKIKQQHIHGDKGDLSGSNRGNALECDVLILPSSEKQVFSPAHADDITLILHLHQAAAAIAEAVGLVMGVGDDTDAYWHSCVLPQLVQVYDITAPALLAALEDCCFDAAQVWQQDVVFLFSFFASCSLSRAVRFITARAVETSTARCSEQH
jgi:hypothetical protein